MKFISGKLAAGIAAAFIFAAPVAAGALTADEVRAQIETLLKQIAGLQEQIRVLSSSTASSSVTVTDPSRGYGTAIMPVRACAIFNRDLSLGARGDDVTSLQEFLYEQKILTVAPTGYFGQMTADAVKRWQASEGVSAAGYFGPLSRERMKIRCGNWSGGNTERFSATPMSGSAPLTVTFSTWLSGFRVNTISYNIDYGDGTSERAADCPAPADACVSPGQNTHTYTKDGMYTATLNKVTDPCAGQVACRAAIHSEVVAKQQIVVGNVACTKEYKPVCGSKQVTCITAPCNPVQTTYSNTCMMAADGATFLYEGQCKDSTTDPAADSRCKAWYDGCNSCSRNAPGEPAACTLRYCYAPGKAYCTAYFDNSASTNKPPVINSFSGPTTLSVNSTGTWTVLANDPEGGQMTYSVWWGDENVYAASMTSADKVTRFLQTTTFTHAYANAGTYTVTVIAKDSAGQEAKTTTTVKVGSEPVICTMEYAPVCGRPAGCANNCAPGFACPAICQLHTPQTYGNLCQLNAAGAQKLHTGECNSNSSSYYY